LSAQLLPGPFWLIGCGNMAGAMLEGWLAKGIGPAQITVIRPSGKAVAPGVRVLKLLPEDEVPALVMLGVKPQKLDEVVPVLAPVLEPNTILISMLAGIEQETLRQRFSKVRHIVKAMPNTPVRLGKGVVNLFSDSEDERARTVVADLMRLLGHVEWFEEEQLFQIAGHLSAAGPAFLFRFIDALAAAGKALGLPWDQSARLAGGMVEGAAALAAASDESPSQLAERVASPGGTTRAGMNVLDSDEALRALVLRTLDASRRRGLELAEAARSG
jgi:pyrroline-5-carboxylate reductase